MPKRHLPGGSTASGEVSLADLLCTALAGQGASKAAMVELTSHHANHFTLIEGDPVPVHLSRSRAVKGAR